MSDWSPRSYQPLRPAEPVDLPGDALGDADWWLAEQRGDGTPLPVDASAWDESGWLTFDAFNDGVSVLQLLLLLSREASEGIGRDASANAELGPRPRPGSPSPSRCIRGRRRGCGCRWRRCV